MEKAKQEKEAHGEIETAHPGYLGAQDTYYVGTIKSIGRIYQQTFIDTYTKVAFAKLYDRKNALVAADMLNDRVLPFFEEQEVSLLRILTDRGTEYCGQREHHEYQLYLAVENIDHSRTKTKHPQTNGICERFHKTMQDEFYSVAFRKKLYSSLEQLQTDLDLWLEEYNQNRPHSGKYCFEKRLRRRSWIPSSWLMTNSSTVSRLGLHRTTFPRALRARSRCPRAFIRSSLSYYNRANGSEERIRPRGFR